MSNSGSPKASNSENCTAPQDVLNSLLKTVGRLRKGIKADNSSLFACFSDLIYFGGDNFHRVKETFLDHIDANKFQYSEVIAHDLGKDIETYVADVQKSSTTTSTFELKILSELYSVNVELFTFDGSQLQRTQISNRYINSLSLLEYQPGMYDSLISNHAIRSTVVAAASDSTPKARNDSKTSPFERKGSRQSSTGGNFLPNDAVSTEKEDFVITRADSGLAARRKEFADLTVSVSGSKPSGNGPETGSTASKSGIQTGGSSARNTGSAAKSSSRVNGTAGFNFRKDQGAGVNFDFTKASRNGGALSAPVIRKTSYFDFKKAEGVLKDQNSAFYTRSATSRKIGGGPDRFFGKNSSTAAKQRVPDMFKFGMDDVLEEADEEGARSGSNAGTPIPPGFNAHSRAGQTPGKRKTPIPEKSNLFKTRNFVPETRSVQRYTGTLKFFDEKKNFGFIIMDNDPDHDVFVHYDDISKSDISKPILKMKNKVIQLSFVLMEYHGKSKQSRKAIDIALEGIRDKTEAEGSAVSGGVSA